VPNEKQNCNLQSIGASIEAVCRETLQVGKGVFDHKGRTIWITDAHRHDDKCYVVRSDEKLTAFLKLEVTIRFAGEIVLTCSTEGGHCACG